MTRYLNASKVATFIGKTKWASFEDKVTLVKKLELNEPSIESVIDNMTESQVSQTMHEVGLDVSGDNNKLTLTTELKKRKHEVINEIDHHEFVKSEEEVVRLISSKDLNEVIKMENCKQRGDVVEDRKIHEHNFTKTNKLNYLSFTKNGYNYKIGGRFDADEGVEIKTRRHKFLGVPEYENIQIQLYMEMSGAKSWKLLECFNDEEREHLMHRDNILLDNIKNEIHENWEQTLFNLNLK
jgi:hypothetical protein